MFTICEDDQGMDPADLIDALGGSAAVAEFLGAELNTVCNWRLRGFPAWALVGLGRMCSKRKVDPGDSLEPVARRRRVG